MSARPGYHYTGQGHAHYLSPKQVMQLAHKYGLPGRGIMQIARGESGLDASVQQRDPGDGMVGYGLLQMTPNAWGKGSAAYRYMQKLGGIGAMKDPEKNMQMARFLYKAAGNSFKPWYGTRYLTDRSGEGTLGPVRNGMQVAGGAGPTYRTVPGVDNSALRQQAQIQYLQTSHDPNALLMLAQGLRGAQDTPSRRVRVPGRTSAPSSHGTGGNGGGRFGTLYEMFWQGAGGIDVKDGSRVPQGFVDGHKDHVHIAARQNDLLKLGKLAQRMGLHVGENPAFGGVNPVHVHGSYHYGRTRGHEHDRAIDVSGDAAQMRRFAHRVARMYRV